MPRLRDVMCKDKRVLLFESKGSELQLNRLVRICKLEFHF